MSSRILVVEDDRLQRMLIKAALLADGHQVEDAADGLDAVWRIRDGQFDLVLIDYQLPEIDGLATARLVRDIMGESARPSLVALTASPKVVLGREVAAGPAFDGVLTKSMDLSTLLTTVNDILRTTPTRRARRDAEDALLLQEWSKFDVPLARPGVGDDRPKLGRVLVVEDDEIQRRILTIALERHAYAVESCGDGLTAVRMLCESGFDAALIDYELPEIDGFASARLLGTLLSESVRPRLIAFTANPKALASRTEGLAVFDEVVNKQDGLNAAVTAVTRTIAAAHCARAIMPELS